jgi:ADP-heptose:LPS heptosyltransferase
MSDHQEKATTNTEEKASKKVIGIIQITRIGDILQTYIAAKALKKQRPEVRIVLVARKQFVTPLKDIISDGFDKIYPLDYQAIFKAPQNGLEGARAELKSYLSELSEEDMSVLVNLSFGKTSSYLSRLIKAKFKLGPHYKNTPDLEITDYWSQYVYSNVMGGPLCPFNLVDIYKSILGVEPSSSEEHGASTTNTEAKNIYLHPFASHSKKVWKTSKWIEFCYKLLKDNADKNVFIVGSKADSEQAQTITENPLLSEFSSRIHSLTGKTTINELFERLKTDCQLFVGHDSMVGHLASVAGVKTLTISVGPTRPAETTPYGENNYNISSRNEHTGISYTAINTLAQELIDHGCLRENFHKDISNSFRLNTADIYSSYFSGNGIQRLRLESTNPPSLQEIFRSYYRIAWYFLFTSQEEKGAYPKLTQNTHEQLLNYMPGIQHLYELSEFGKKYSKYILQELSSDNPNMQSIKEFGQKIDEIDGLTGLIKTNYPMLAPIVDYFSVVKSNLAGENIVELTQSSYLAYEDSSSITSIVYEFIEKTIAEHKITNQKTAR